MKLTAKLHFNEIESRFPASQAPAIPAYGSETGEVTEGASSGRSPPDHG